MKRQIEEKVDETGETQIIYDSAIEDWMEL